MKDPNLEKLKELLGTTVLITYFHLLENGPSKISELAKKSGLNKGTIKKNLDRLMKAGFVKKEGQRYIPVKEMIIKLTKSERFMVIRDINYEEDATKTIDLLLHALESDDIRRFKKYKLFKLYLKLKKMFGNEKHGNVEGNI